MKSPGLPGKPGTKSTIPFAGLNKNLFGPGPECVIVPTNLSMLAASANSNMLVVWSIATTSPASNP